MSAKVVAIMFKHFSRDSNSKPEHSTNTSFVFSVILPVNSEFIIGGILNICLLSSIKIGNIIFPFNKWAYSLPAGCFCKISKPDICFSNSNGINFILSGSNAL